MEKYDYMAAVCEDVRAYIEDNQITVNYNNRKQVKRQLNDTLFGEDSVTGNASGSYTFNTREAEANISNNLVLLSEACEEFGCNAVKLLEKGAEACDVTIRCYLLREAITAVLNNIKANEHEKVLHLYPRVNAKAGAQRIGFGGSNENMRRLHKECERRNIRHVQRRGKRNAQGQARTMGGNKPLQGNWGNACNSQT